MTRFIDLIIATVVSILEIMVRVIPIVVSATACFNSLVETGSVVLAVVGAGKATLLSLTLILPVYWLLLFIVTSLKTNYK